MRNGLTRQKSFSRRTVHENNLQLSRRSGVHLGGVSTVEVDNSLAQETAELHESMLSEERKTSDEYGLEPIADTCPAE